MDWLKKKFKKTNEGESGIERGKDDPLLWYSDLEKYAYGKYSYAAVRVRNADEREEYSQIVPGPKAALVGVYDGHNGHEAAQYVSGNLYNTLLERIKTSRAILPQDIQFAFGETEKGFLEDTETKTPHPTMNQHLLIAGTSCLVATIHKKQLILANLGDSRAVLVSNNGHTQLTNDHSVELASVRQMLRHATSDRDIAVRRDGVFLYKGMPNLQTPRAIGDLYLKEARFNRATTTSPFFVRGASYPMMQSEPEIIGPRSIGILDQCLIIASRGFWEHITNEEATAIVRGKRKEGIARRLVVTAMESAAEKKNMTYNELKQIQEGEERRAIHEDMTVVVLFFSHMKFYMKASDELYTVRAFAGRDDGIADLSFP